MHQQYTNNYNGCQVITTLTNKGHTFEVVKNGTRIGKFPNLAAALECTKNPPPKPTKPRSSSRNSTRTPNP